MASVFRRVGSITVDGLVELCDLRAGRIFSS